MQFDRPTKAILALLSCRERGAPVPRVELTDSEWSALARTAVRHGVAPLVYARLSTTGDRVPPHVLDVLKGYFFRTGLENLRLYARLAPVLRALAEQGIDAIVLKGAFLADTVYEDRALRSMGDADLLVRRVALPRVDQTLRSLGWDQPVADDATAPRQARGHQLQTFVRDSARIEVHWSIEDDDSPFAIDVDGLWQRAHPVQVAGVSALALAPEDLLLHLCLHASYNHGWLQFEAGLRPLVDIDATLQHFAHRVDWDVFTQRAFGWKVQRCAWLTLTLANYLLGADVPERVVAALAPEAVNRDVVDSAVTLALSNYYAEVTHTLPALGRRWLTKRRQILSVPAWWREVLWPDIDALTAAYPSVHGAPPVRYLIHWIDLTRDTLRVSLGREGRRLASCERTRMLLAGWLEAPAA
jgi:Uncharacterised nucleotidyltransferase